MKSIILPSGLSRRTVNCLTKAGIPIEKAAVIRALNNGTLCPYRNTRHYGKITHREVCRWVRVDELTLLPLTEAGMSPPYVLFICTANYYRSRFCEHLFNHLAAQSHLTWMAISRGVATELGAGNVGPISPYAILGLQARGVPLPDAFRGPEHLWKEDLQSADHIIVLDEDEHRPFMERKFPAWADKVTYWHVGDLHVATSEEALALAEENIRTLFQRLCAPMINVVPEPVNSKQCVTT